MKFFYQIAYKLIKIYWRVFKPITTGVRILLVQDDKIVLVKHTYEDAWYLPGGGLKRGETLAEAAHREIKEEVNGVVQSFSLMGVYTNFSQIKTDHIIVFSATDFTWQAQPDKAEIEQIAQFSFDTLPPNLSPGTQRRISEYLRKEPVQHGVW